MKKANEYKNEIINDIKGLVRINSVLEKYDKDNIYPFGKGIFDSLDYVLKLGEKMGFKTKNVDNMAGHIEYGEGEEIIGVLTHVDVVPAEGKWEYDPFEAKMVGDLIYGRGTNDDKGPTICSLYALKILKDSGFLPKKRIRLIIGTDEETAWRGIDRYFEKEEMPAVGFSPDADFPIIYGEKGILSLDLTINEKSDFTLIAGSRYNVVIPQATFIGNYNIKETENIRLVNNKYEVSGKSAHAMEPDNGINAALLIARELKDKTDNKMIKFMNDCLMNSRLKDMNLDYTDEEMGDLTMNLGIVCINEDSGKLCLNFRYPIGLDFPLFINKFISKCNEYNINVEIKENKKPHYINPNDEFIKILHKAYIDVTGDDKTKLLTIGGGTYARALKKGVAFGALFPNEEELAHQPNEYININSALKTTDIYVKALYELTK